MRHVVISTAMRGRVNPPEPLDFDNQLMVEAGIERETARAEQENAPRMSQWRAREYAKNPPRGEYIYLPAQNVLMNAMGRR